MERKPRTMSFLFGDGDSLPERSRPTERHGILSRYVLSLPGRKSWKMSYEILTSHRKIWQKKKVLRDIYHDWYRLIIENITTVIIL